MSLAWRKFKDKALTCLAVLSVGIALVPLISILYTVVYRGFTSVGLDFFTALPKPVGEPSGGFGNAIQGSFIVVGIACMIGLPVSILSGIYLAEYGNNRFGRLVSFVADVLTGMPSIVTGIFAYVFVVLYLDSFSALAGGAALAFMMIPVVVRTTEEAMKLVPVEIREASLALGIPQWKTSLRIVLSTARFGVITGVLLAVARISGETAPLLFTSFNNQYWFDGILNPVATLPVMIYTYAISPFEEWHAQAWGGALVLIFVMLMLNIGVRFAARQRY